MKLKIDEMSFAEKLSAFEILWAEIHGYSDEQPSPEWHYQILAEREALEKN